MKGFISKYLFILPALLLLCTALSSCSERDDEETEFVDWKNSNEHFFNNIYNTAKADIAAGGTNWKVIKTWTKRPDTLSYVSPAEDYIVAEVLEVGSGTTSPLYTDSVYIHYQGRLLPSTSYSDGMIFDQSYYGEYNPATAQAWFWNISNGLVDGFATALQNMHIGDRWRVYIPYQLGYGTATRGSIPAYSTLVFDIRLVGYYRPSISRAFFEEDEE